MNTKLSLSVTVYNTQGKNYYKKTVSIQSCQIQGVAVRQSAAQELVELQKQMICIFVCNINLINKYRIF